MDFFAAIIGALFLGSFLMIAASIVGNNVSSAADRLEKKLDMLLEHLQEHSGQETGHDDE